MYKIIGADGKEYGPVSGEQLQQWIAEGRANSSTRVLAEGTSDWKPLSDFPEFAASLAARAVPAGGTPPTADPAAAERLADEILNRNPRLEIGRCLSRGWSLVMGRFWLTVGASFVAFLLVVAASAIPFASLLLTYVFWGGLYWFFQKLIRGERAEIGDVFAGFNLAFVPLMLFSVVGQLLTAIGLLLCLLPGIYLAVVWLVFTPLLILEYRLDFWPAMEVCRKVVNRLFWPTLGFCLVSTLILLAGLLACGIGFFVAVPVVTAATIYAYEDIFARRPAPAPGA
jgi:hypothetical protein